jgi:predicted phage baseplate assembly protein
VTRGETVANEVLGNGDASQAGQEFVLKKSPLTYVLDPSSSSGENYKSTLRVWVNGIEWTEVASFYGQKHDATVFVTREDDLAKSHVQFGDGYNGARLATGIRNVVASYRVGSGAESPTAGTLTVVLQPQPGLKAIRNPVPVGGGADPDPPDQIRRYAPRSVLTFGRAVSWLDYETIAAQAPGVARARAYWSWDSNEQRNLVKVYVGDDQAAVDAAKLALGGAEDPNRPISVFLAEAISDPDVIVRVEPLQGRKVSDVRASVTSALFDDQMGLFGIHNVRIGKPVYESQIVAACMNAVGVAAVHFVEFSTNVPDVNGVLWDPGEGKFFLPDPINLWVDVEGSP